jgi:hypothetical protein
MAETRVLASTVGAAETTANVSKGSAVSSASEHPPAGIAARRARNKTHRMTAGNASLLGLLQGNDARKSIVLKVIEERVIALTSMWMQGTRLMNLLVMQCLAERNAPPANTQKLVRQCL